MSRFKAGSKCVTELFSSVLSATLVIIICFLPMPFFMSGTAGDFIRSLPLTITFALLISLLISVTLIPLVSYTLIKTGIRDLKRSDGRPTFLERLQTLYNSVLEKAFAHKTLVVAVGLVSFIIGLALLAVIPRQSFPKIERNQFAVEVYLAEGSSLQQTDAVMRDLEKVLARDSRIRVVTSFVGTSSPRFHTLYSPNFAAKHYGQMVVLTESSDATVNILDEYSRRMYNHYPQADIKWKQLAFDIQKAPIEVRISGDSIRTLRQTADLIAGHLRKIEGTEYVRSDYGRPRPIIDLEVKRDQAALLGYSTAVLENSLMVGVKGLPVSTVWEGDYPVSVKLKIDKKIKTKPEEIADLYVTSPLTAVSVPVRQIAEIKPGWSEAEIIRRNGVRTMTVRAEVKRGLYPTYIFNQIRPIVDNMKWPEGITITYGGDYQDTQENMTPFYYSLAASVTLIFLILMFQFKKTRTSLLIMATLPLSVFGAAVGVLLTGYPFGVTAFVGLIGLMGIVVRNGVIFISYADELRTGQGFTAEEAAMSAGRRRMRPIFLTSAAAAVGVIPMILSGSSLWGPLGAVICSGLFFALALSLLVLPVLYYYFHRNDAVAIKEGE